MRARKARRSILSVLMLLFGLVWLYPVLMVVINSFKSRAEMYESFLALPKSLSFDFYLEAMQKMDFGTALKNSLILTVASCLCIIVLASMCAWMLVRNPHGFSRFMYAFFVAVMLVPFQTLMMPLMQEMGWIHKLTGLQMRNTLGGMVYMYVGFGAPMAVFLFHGFVKSIPVSLEEAAVIDGCGKWSTFWRIVFPLLKPTTMTVAIIDVIWIWNDYLLPALSLTSQKTRTIPLASYAFFGNFKVEWTLAMAALTLTIIPVVVFYLAAQKYIVKGVAAGAVKG